jgi:hypothetical protein
VINSIRKHYTKAYIHKGDNRGTIKREIFDSLYCAWKTFLAFFASGGHFIILRQAFAILCFSSGY